METLFNVVTIISFIASIIIMTKLKGKISKGTIIQEPLSKKEKIIVWVTCLLTPFFAGLVYYFGWKKVFPQKAKQANKILWTSLIIWAFISFTYSALFSVE